MPQSGYPFRNLVFEGGGVKGIAYSGALAVLEDEVLMDDAHVATAIRLVERYYTGHQPRFFHWFLSHWRGALLGRFAG